jgi:hypothetical protein
MNKSLNTNSIKNPLNIIVLSIYFLCGLLANIFSIGILNIYAFYLVVSYKSASFLAISKYSLLYCMVSLKYIDDDFFPSMM